MPPAVEPAGAAPVAQVDAPTKGGGPAPSGDLMTTLQSLAGAVGALSAALGAKSISGGGAAAPVALPSTPGSAAAVANQEAEAHFSLMSKALDSKLASFGPLTPAENASVSQLKTQAARDRKFSPSGTQAVLIPIQARLSGFSPTAFTPVINRLRVVDQSVDQQLNALKAKATAGGHFTPAEKNSMQAVTNQQAALSEALKNGVDQARANPAAAALIASQIR